MSETSLRTDATEPLLLSVSDAVRISGLPRSKMYLLLQRGAIAGVIEGNRRMIRTASLRSYIDGLKPIVETAR